jgi:hypothetical protein
MTASGKAEGTHGYPVDVEAVARSLAALHYSADSGGRPTTPW